jgi:IS1 family transposase
LANIDEEVTDNQGDMWTFVAVLPGSGFVHTSHTSARNLKEANIFVAKIKANSNGIAPLYHSDCWFYEQALKDNYCSYQEVPYKGRGRKPHPKQVVDPELKYVQVHKKRDAKGKIEAISTRIVLGDEREILNILHDANRCKTINTDYVESRNGKYRKDNARLIRKTLCHSKKGIFHKAHIEFLTQVFNYTRINKDFSEIINPNAKKFETKYAHKTPAMVEGLIDKTLTLKELLCQRPMVNR